MRVCLPGIRHAGSMFIGPHSPEAAGDYASGPNHVLPTSGAARLRGGLSAADYVKVISTQEVSAGGARGSLPRSRRWLAPKVWKPTPAAWKRGSRRLAMAKRIRPREAVLQMAPYHPPTGGRADKLRLDFNENTIGCSPKVIEFLKQRLDENRLAVYPEYVRGEARPRRVFRGRPKARCC